MPIHFTRFFPAYKLTSLPPTPIETLEEAAGIADEEGMQYVYIGNTPGHESNSTFGPGAGSRSSTAYIAACFRWTSNTGNAGSVGTRYRASGGIDQYRL